MLNEKDARHDSLRRIADTLRISVDVLYGAGENSMQYEQTNRMLILWDGLTTDSLREDALNAVRLVIDKGM